ncbi:hypothetical protein ABT112_09120 [Streptomyces sp. NPDC002055]|uniref:hypothetical protein n=1 Tax=Streptomyces sp. NPDC002055 TaxID=3154534 RepID=UPI00331F7D60
MHVIYGYDNVNDRTGDEMAQNDRQQGAIRAGAPTPAVISGPALLPGPRARPDRSVKL